MERQQRRKRRLGISDQAMESSEGTEKGLLKSAWVGDFYKIPPWDEVEIARGDGGYQQLQRIMV